MSLDRKRKTKDPCAKCFMHKDLCLCALIPSLTIATRVVLVIHAKELKRTTNTGRLAVMALTNSEMRVRGLDHTPLDLSDLADSCTARPLARKSEYRSVMFFPSDDAVELTPEFVAKDPRPILLIVPDGNWRQASKVHHRHQELQAIPRVKIGALNLATDHLRAESMPEGLATLQAIAHALGVIEGAQVREILLALYEQKLERTLIGRGLRQRKTISPSCLRQSLTALPCTDSQDLDPQSEA
jgi:DTW domain-containing protein YfiP